MERVLILAEIYPFPFTTGGKLRTANLIIQLSKKYTVDFFCYSLDRVAPDQIEMAKEYCDNVAVIEGNMPSTMEKLFNLLTIHPNAEFISRSEEMKKLVKKATDERAYKFILVERLYAFQYAEDVCDRIPVMLDMHDIEHEAMAYFSKIANSLPQKWHYKLEEKKVRGLEARAFNKAKRVLTVSKRDLLEYESGYPELKNKAIYVNNGIDLSKALNEPVVKREKANILFVGSLKHPPNLHGLKWFVENAWPPILEKYPEAVFTIVGSGRLADEDQAFFENATGVHFLGFVENLYPLLRKETCLVVPLFSGSGTRLKILEAFSFRLPVISTTVGAEGISYSDGKDILIADSAEEMLSKVSQILEDEETAIGIAEHAYELVEGEYNWDVIGNILVEDIERVLK